MKKENKKILMCTGLGLLGCGSGIGGFAFLALTKSLPSTTGALTAICLVCGSLTLLGTANCIMGIRECFKKRTFPDEERGVINESIPPIFAPEQETTNPLYTSFGYIVKKWENARIQEGRRTRMLQTGDISNRRTTQVVEQMFSPK